MSEHKILWTGGWDSTYRVLDLVIVKNAAVTPYYLIDNDRKGASIEIETMEKIRLQVEREYPQAHGRIQPLKIFSRHETPENPEITEAYHALKTKMKLGSQYEWLARFCEHKGIDEIELSVEKDAKERKIVSGARAAFVNTVVPVRGELETVYRVASDNPDSEEYKLFRYFTFPILHTTKMEMRALARKNGFLHILENSWFCHFPIRNKSCGKCHPCRLTIENGMGYRLPLVSRFIRYPQRKLEKGVEQMLSGRTVARLKRFKNVLGG